MKESLVAALHSAGRPPDGQRLALPLTAVGERWSTAGRSGFLTVLGLREDAGPGAETQGVETDETGGVGLVVGTFVGFHRRDIRIVERHGTLAAGGDDVAFVECQLRRVNDAQRAMSLTFTKPFCAHCPLSLCRAIRLSCCHRLHRERRQHKQTSVSGRPE